MFDELIEFLKELKHAPWWVSVVVGILFYLSVTELMPRVVGDGPMVSQVRQVLSWLSLLFLVPAVISAHRRLHGRYLLATNRSIDSIRSLDWQTFEELIEAYYRDHGFRTQRQIESGADGGVDVRISNDRGERYLVQCKQWRSRKIGVKVVRELYGIVAAEGATGGIVISSGSFTHEAQSFANGVAIELIDGNLLQQSLGDRIPKITVTNRARPEETTLCPRCGSTLVLRKARRGASAGSTFYGCSSYPRCRYTRD